MDIIKLTFVLLLFYLIWLGSYPLFTPDEGRYSEVAREMLVTGDMITPRVNGVVFLDKPVLYYWLQATAIYLFGLNEWALRFFPALFGVGGSVLVYACGRRLFDRRTGLISAIVLATAPLYFGAAHYANLDLEVAVFVSAALVFFICGTVNARRPSHPSSLELAPQLNSCFLFLAAVFAALAFLTKGLLGLVFPILVIGAWVLFAGRSIIKKWHVFLAGGIFLIIVLPWYVLVQKANPSFLHYFFITQQVSRFLSSGEFNNSTPVWFYVPVVLLGFFPWTCFLVPAIVRSVHQVWVYKHQNKFFLLLWVAIIFVFFSVPRSKVITYIVPIFPALALLIGNYLSSFWDEISSPRFYWQTSIFILLNFGIAVIFFVVPYYHWFNLSAEFTPYLYTFAAIYLMGAIAALVVIQQFKLGSLFFISAICNTAFLGLLIMGAADLNQNTAKPLANELKKILLPQDEVVNYFKFYQDVPIYLERRITLVANWNSPNIIENDNWARELWYGMPFQNTQDWLIDENTFWKRWDSTKRIFVFVNENYFDQFKLHAHHYFLLGRYKEILLLSNQLVSAPLEYKRLGKIN